MTVVIDKRNQKDFELSLLHAYSEVLYMSDADSLNDVFGSRAPAAKYMRGKGEEVVRSNLFRSVAERMKGDRAVEEQFVALVHEMLSAELELDERQAKEMNYSIYEWYSDMKAPRNRPSYVMLDAALMDADFDDEDEDW